MIACEPATGQLPEFWPLTAPGLPLPGPDFVALARLLGDDEPVIDRKTKRLLACGPALARLYRSATCDNGFQLPVAVKGQRVTVTFLTGHVWGGPSGPAASEVMVIGKCPGHDEMRCMKFFAGLSGQVLQRGLLELGVQRHEFMRWYVTNVFKHVPLISASKTFSPASWSNNAMILQQELRIVRPQFILCLGNEAAQAVLGRRVGGVTQTKHQKFDVEWSLAAERSEDAGDEPRHRATVVTCLHPAAVGYEPEAYPDFLDHLSFFVDTLRGCARTLPPLDCEIITDVEHLERAVQQVIDEGGVNLAVDCEWHGDYPTDRNAWLRTLQFTHRPRKAYIVVFRRQGGVPAFKPEPSAAVPALKRLFLDTADRKVRLIGHNLRADLPWIELGLDAELGQGMRRQFVAPLGDPDPDGVNRLFGWQKTAFAGGFDTMLAAHAVNELAGETGYKLESLVQRDCKIPRWDRDLQQWKRDYCQQRGLDARDLEGYGECPDDILLGSAEHPSYAGWDVAGTWEEFDHLNRPGGALDADRFGNNCRIPFWLAMLASPACLEMEMTGILLDTQRVRELSELYRSATQQLLSELRELIAWPNFNPRSCYDCRALLFGWRLSGKVDPRTGQVVNVVPAGAITLDLDPLYTSARPRLPWEEVVRRGQTHMFNPTTDHETLGILLTRLEADPAGKTVRRAVELLRGVRFLDSMLTRVLSPRDGNADETAPTDGEGGERSEFTRGLASWVHDDGRIRTHIFQTKETGRYATARPPMQNLSKRRESDYARILGDQYRWPIRSMFRATPGWVLVEADLIGAELGMMAVQSGDELMIEHSRRSSLPENHPDYYDIHSHIAVKAFRLDVEPTKKALREAGYLRLRDVEKVIIFRSSYGGNSEGIVRTVEEEGIKITVEQAEAVRQEIFSTYPRLRPYFQACHDRVLDPGWLANWAGRYRRFYPATDAKTLAAMQREASNFTIQGGIADLLNIALGRLYSLPDRVDDRGELRFRMLLPIHDAVKFEVRVDDLEWFLGDAEHPGALFRGMSQVPVFRADLDGRILSPVPHYFGIEYALYEQWGVPLSRERGLQLGVPVKYLPGVRT